MKSVYVTFVSVLFVSVLLIAVYLHSSDDASNAINSSSDRNNISVTYPFPDEIVKMLIQLYDPKNQSRDMSDIEAKLENQIGNLINAKSDEELATIALLFDYNLDGALGEQLSWIAKQKGQRMEHLLYVKKISQNDCLKRFGNKPFCNPLFQDPAVDDIVLSDLQEGVRSDLSKEPLCKTSKIADYDKRVLLLALDIYYNDNNKYPSTLKDLQQYFQTRYISVLRIHTQQRLEYIYEIRNNIPIIECPKNEFVPPK